MKNKLTLGLLLSTMVLGSGGLVMDAITRNPVADELEASAIVPYVPSVEEERSEAEAFEPRSRLRGNRGYYPGLGSIEDERSETKRRLRRHLAKKAFRHKVRGSLESERRDWREASLKRDAWKRGYALGLRACRRNR